MVILKPRTPRDIDGSVAHWRPTLHRSQIDVDGDPVKWARMAVVACPNCGNQFGVRVDEATGISTEKATCGYFSPAVPRLERPVYAIIDGKRTLIRTDVREARPEFRCAFSDEVTLEGFAASVFVGLEAEAAADVARSKRARVKARIVQETFANQEAEIEAKVDVELAKLGVITPARTPSK